MLGKKEDQWSPNWKYSTQYPNDPVSNTISNMLSTHLREGMLYDEVYNLVETHIGKLIGSGSYGKVYDVRSNENYVVKVMCGEDACPSYLEHIMDTDYGVYETCVPVVYSLLRDEDYSVVVMERLVPLEDPYSDAASEAYKNARTGRSSTEKLLRYSRALAYMSDEIWDVADHLDIPFTSLYQEDDKRVAHGLRRMLFESVGSVAGVNSEMVRIARFISRIEAWNQEGGYGSMDSHSGNIMLRPASGYYPYQVVLTDPIC